MSVSFLVRFKLAVVALTMAALPFVVAVSAVVTTVANTFGF
jgi:hypothetical protein